MAYYLVITVFLFLFFNDRKRIRFQQEKFFIPFYYIMTEERAEASRRS